jgi:hypothetical protein
MARVELFRIAERIIVQFVTRVQRIGRGKRAGLALTKIFIKVVGFSLHAKPPE